jgi:DNA-binding MarR family transcriptional regulator
MSENRYKAGLDAADTAELLIQVGRLAYSDSPELALTPTQWMALRYFARANRFSRTVSAFAEYHATTRGTVSQTIKTLTERGYLSRNPSELDGRSVRLDLTAQGRAAVRSDPLARLIELVDDLPPAGRDGLQDQLRYLAAGLAKGLERPPFGLCRHCRFLHAAADSDSSQSLRCRLLEADLEADDLARICVNFNPA